MRDRVLFLEVVVCCNLTIPCKISSLFFFVCVQYLLQFYNSNKCENVHVEKNGNLRYNI